MEYKFLRRKKEKFEMDFYLIIFLGSPVYFDRKMSVTMTFIHSAQVIRHIHTPLDLSHQLQNFKGLTHHEQIYEISHRLDRTYFKGNVGRDVLFILFLAATWIAIFHTLSLLPQN